MSLMAMKAGEYQTDLGKLKYVGKQGVLCLLGESIYSRHNGYTAPKNHSVEYIKKLFKSR